MRRADPHQGLVRALHRRHPHLQIVSAQTEPWASATFTGMRHLLRCTPLSLDGLEDAEFGLPGNIVADITFGFDAGLLIIDALTIETD